LLRYRQIHMPMSADEIAQLKELASLKDAGVLSEEEFTQQKEDLLKKSAASAGTAVATGIEVSDVKPVVPVQHQAAPVQQQQAFS